MPLKPVELPPIDDLRAAFAYDAETGVITRRRNGVVAGTLSSNRYLNVSFNSRTILAHRLAWALANGSLSVGDQVDHINGVKTDNRLVNLRLTRDMTNSWNKAVRKDNVLGHKFIYFDHERQSYRLTITRAGKQYRRRFKSLADALAAQERFAVRHDGFYANDGEFAERSDRVKDVASAFEKWRSKRIAA